MKKLHKYNVGDELTIKISAIREKNGKIAYDIEGLNGLSFAESTIDNIAQKKLNLVIPCLESMWMMKKVESA